MSEPIIRFMNVEDIARVLVVEHDAFAVPWTENAFYNELTTNQFAKYVVMELDEKIIGYCGVWIVVDEAHITNIAIHSKYRGKGYGEMLFQSVIELSKMFGAQTMTLEVRVSNIPAQNLYKKLGFLPGGIRKNYYSDNGEDALVMWVNLNEQG